MGEKDMENIKIEITIKNDIEGINKNDMKDILNIKGYNNALSRLNNSLSKNRNAGNYSYKNENETGGLLDVLV